MAEEYLNHGSRVVATVRSAQRTGCTTCQTRPPDGWRSSNRQSPSPSTSSTCTTAFASRTFDLLFVNARRYANNPRTPSPTSQPRSSPGLCHQRAEPDAGDRGTRRPRRTRTARSLSCPPDRAASPTTNAAASRSTAAPRAALNTFMRSYAARHPQRPPNAAAHGRVGQDSSRRSERTPHHQREHPNLVKVIDAPERSRRASIPRLSGETVAW